MIKKFPVFLTATLLACSLSAADPANRISFPLAGFSIAPLDTAPGTTPTQTAVMMFLPVKGGFTGNVNVMIQTYPGTMEDYTALTVKQFKENDLKMVSQKNIGKSAAIFEYTGLMQGNPLHWYARAEKNGDHIYLVTATTAENQWSAQATRLKTCVESFRCDKH